MDITITPAVLTGEVQIPASKSHTIRALLIASLAEGRSIISNPLTSNDAVACVEACRQLGATIDTTGPDWFVEGLGGKIIGAESVIDTLNSGTTLYLATAIAALGQNWSFFTGDHQIRRRSAGNLLTALEGLGIQIITAKGNDCAPYAVKGPWKGGRISIECPTSQFLSSLLLAAPLAPAGIVTEIDVPLLNEVPYAEMTLKWLEDQNIQLENRDLKYFRIPGGQKFKSFAKPVPGDWSSATFFAVAAGIFGTAITLRGLDIQDSQGDKAILDYMKAMGAEVSIEMEPAGTNYNIVIDGKGLKGAVLDLNYTPDALPALAVLGCFAQGETRLINVAHARLKETDRISVMCQELKKMGARIEEKPDGLVIQHSPLKGATLHGHHDHRVVMSLTLAALGAKGSSTLDTIEAAAVTFPNFFELVDQLKQ